MAIFAAATTPEGLSPSPIPRRPVSRFLVAGAAGPQLVCGVSASDVNEGADVPERNTFAAISPSLPPVSLKRLRRARGGAPGGGVGTLGAADRSRFATLDTASTRAVDELIQFGVLLSSARPPSLTETIMAPNVRIGPRFRDGLVARCLALRLYFLILDCLCFYLHASCRGQLSFLCKLLTRTECTTSVASLCYFMG